MSTYYTKCGREFQKSTKAAVTGYKIAITDTECATCHFRIKVTKGWPAVFDHWECRAGSEKPNNTNEWVGSLEDKNSIHIKSLDHDFLESIIAYCKEQPDFLSAGYTQDTADCRQAISVSCSSNKKGIAAKVALVEKFFPENQTDWPSQNCIDCKNCKDRECIEGVFKNCCPSTISDITKACPKFEAVENDCFEDYEDIESMDLEEQLSCLLKDNTDQIKEIYLDLNETEKLCPYFMGTIADSCPAINCNNINFGDLAWGKSTELRDNYVNTRCKDEKEKCFQYMQHEIKRMSGKPPVFNRLEELEGIYSGLKEAEQLNCKLSECGFNDDAAGCCGFDKNDIKCSAFMEYAKRAIDLGCKNKDLKAAYKTRNEERKPRIGTKTGCNEMREDCPCFCKHNDGCSILLIKGNALKAIIEEYGDIDCNVYRKVAEKVKNKPETDNETANIVTKEHENITETTEINTKTETSVTFDYSTVDADTAEFLQERANKITEIRVRSVIEIGKELKEVHERLANHYNGTFGKWCESLGFSRFSGNNYIKAYDYVVENFNNIDDAKSIQPSLLFAVSKPSAPPELQQAVLDGDITTHKQYKEKEAEWKEAIEQYRHQQDILRTEKQQASINAMDAERRANKLQDELNELKYQIEDNQDNEDIELLKNRIIELEDQLKDKPIETTAVQVVEKIPEQNAVEVKNRLYGLFLAVNQVNKQDMQIIYDTADYAKKMAIAEFLENIRDNAQGYIDILYGVESEAGTEESE